MFDFSRSNVLMLIPKVPRDNPVQPVPRTKNLTAQFFYINFLCPLTPTPSPTLTPTIKDHPHPLTVPGVPVDRPQPLPLPFMFYGFYCFLFQKYFWCLDKYLGWSTNYFTGSFHMTIRFIHTFLYICSLYKTAIL